VLGLTLDDLIAILDLEDLEENLYRGRIPEDTRSRVFGGQVVGQALVAAQRTVAGRPAHSMHGYFLRAGEPSEEIRYEVTRLRDGRSFSTRRVVAMQGDRALFEMSASFQAFEEGLEHQRQCPSGLSPGGELYEDTVKREVGRFRKLDPADTSLNLPIEVRTEGGMRLFDEEELDSEMRTWFRARSPVPDDPVIHQALLAFASDLSLLVSAVRPHPTGIRSPGFRSASVDHAMWFHRPFRMDDWLVFIQESPVGTGGRGFIRGEFFTEAGDLVASATQEGMMRWKPDSEVRQR
jgi:acyl-CoA thioesterase-2